MVDGPAARNATADVVGPCWSERRVATALDISADMLAAWRGAGTVLGLPTSDGVLVYPVSQFQRRGVAFEVKPALLPVLRELKESDPWAVAVLLHTPAPELDGRTPLAWLSDGGAPESLTRLAEVVAREWAAGSVRG